MIGAAARDGAQMVQRVAGERRFRACSHHAHESRRRVGLAIRLDEDQATLEVRVQPLRPRSGFGDELLEAAQGAGQVLLAAPGQAQLQQGVLGRRLSPESHHPD